MESLLNFNFLKDISVKKNNVNKANDKSLSGEEMALIDGQYDSIENKFNNILSDQELNENSLSPEKEKSKKSQEKLNIESTELLLADVNIKTSENNSDSNLGSISTKNKKENNSHLNIARNGSLNFNSHNNEEKILNNIKKVSNQKINTDNLDNNNFNKPISNFENIKKNKINLDSQIIINTGKKSKIKSFFQNYFNYTIKKYSKKNIILKKSQLENFKNYDRKNYQESSIILSNNNINFQKKNSITKEQKKNINSEKNTKELNSLSESNTKLSTERNINNTKENSFDNFDRLKNILDIRSNDIKQRFSQIIENNMKLNNNKFEIQLRPENLGKIYITIEIAGQNVDININSDNVNTIQSLTENNINLQKMLQNNGMNLNNFNFNGNNNKGANKDTKNSEDHTNDNVSVNTKDNNKEDDILMSDKLVYAKA